MTKDEQLEIFDILIKKLKSILETKGDDYTSGDRLENFKLPAKILNTKSEIICIGQILIKITRLASLFNLNKEPKNESVEDNIIDLINYSILLYMIFSENNEK